MSAHPREHEELLAALLAGERRPGDPEVVRALRECARCRERWEHLRSAASRLDAAADEQHALLAGLAHADPAPGEERVLATLERLADGDGLGSRRTSRRLAWLAAAALILAAAWGARRFLVDATEPRAPAWLGNGTLQLLAPRGEVAGGRFERFSWTYTGGVAARFTLRIGKLEDGQGGEWLIEHERLEETTWTPDAEDLEQLPPRIRWEVEAFDEFQRSLGSDSAQAWLSR
jgi:hypothetical protein